MAPGGIIVVVVIMVAMSIYRWRALDRLGRFDVRTEWSWWLFCLGSIGVSVVLTYGGRLVAAIVTAMVLIPLGAYMVAHAETFYAQFPRLDYRRTGWLTIGVGILSSLLAIADLVLRR